MTQFKKSWGFLGPSGMVVPRKTAVSVGHLAATIALRGARTGHLTVLQ